MHLTVNVRNVDDILVDQYNAADSRTGKRFGGDTSDSADA
jgi:hypothetical protein